MDTVQGAKLDIRSSGKPVGAEVRGIDLSQELDDATFAAIKQGRLKMDQILPVSEKAWRTEGSRMFIEMDRPVTVDAGKLSLMDQA